LHAIHTHCRDSKISIGRPAPKMAVALCTIVWVYVLPTAERISTLSVASQRMLMSAPREVIEAEDKATPARKFRLAGIAALGSACTASAVLSIAAASGQAQARTMADAVLPFGNEYLSLAADAIIIGGCGWTWNEEMQTRERNIERIWEEVQRRRGSASGVNRQDRRSKAKFKKSKGFGDSPRDSSATTTPVLPPPSLSSGSTRGVMKSAGVMKQAKSFFDEANAMAKAQAIQLNADLEARGVLAPLDADRRDAEMPSDEPASSSTGTTPAVISKDVALQTVVAPSDGSGLPAVAAPSRKYVRKKKGKQKSKAARAKRL